MEQQRKKIIHLTVKYICIYAHITYIYCFNLEVQCIHKHFFYGKVNEVKLLFITITLCCCWWWAIFRLIFVVIKSVFDCNGNLQADRLPTKDEGIQLVHFFRSIFFFFFRGKRRGEISVNCRVNKLTVLFESHFCDSSSKKLFFIGSLSFMYIFLPPLHYYFSILYKKDIFFFCVFFPLLVSMPFNS